MEKLNFQIPLISLLPFILMLGSIAVFPLFWNHFWEKNRTVIFNGRQRLMINKLLDGLDGKLNSSKWAKMAKCSADTALRDISDLMDKEILRKEPAGGRSTSYELKDKI